MSKVERPANLPPELAPIADEVERIHESALWSTQGQFEQMKLWRVANWIFGVPAAALAAIAGGTGLAGSANATVPAVLALISAGLGAALTTLNPSRRVTQAKSSGDAWLELQTAARQLLTIDLAHLSYDQAREELEKLTVRRGEIAHTADPPSKYAYWCSRKNIEQGDQDYGTDG
jgi:hypothetical protein